ncbi:MAG: hypothetical protein ABI925_11340 [Verrucomicrobiota bacterium]
MAEVVRRANKFALPKFRSGEVDILSLKPIANGKRRRIIGNGKVLQPA